MGHDGIGQSKVCGGGQAMGGENGKGNREIDKRDFCRIPFIKIMAILLTVVRILTVIMRIITRLFWRCW